MNLNQHTHKPDLDIPSRRSDKIAKETTNGFHSLGITPSLMKAVDRLNFDKPTPIQEKAIPAGIKGEDIIAIAQTGSGKTLAFGIPMLQRLSQIKRSAGLILVPTRELALQVDESLKAISRSIHMRSVVIIGGASMIMQRNALKKNPRIIVATPGRLMDHIERRTVNLSNIEVFILDEADRMLDMGFVPDIKKIMKSIPEKRQTMLFSATMPKEIEAIAEKLMEAPTRLAIDRSGATPAEVGQEMFFIPHRDKSRLLAVHLKQRSGPVLVFTRTKRTASRLTTKINNMGFAAAEIHSNRSLGQRRNALEGFKRGKYQILIATDIAARGIDVAGIELVVNYDMPANSEDYVHRIGRTGRAGKTGHAISFATTEQKGSIRSIERLMKTKLAVSVLPTLPSESFFFKEGQRLGRSNEPTRDGRPSGRRFSSDHSPRRSDFRTNKTDRFASKSGDSEQKGFGRKGPQQPASRPNAGQPASSKHRRGNPSAGKPKEGKPRTGEQPTGKGQKPAPSVFTPVDADGDRPFWANFKKSKPPKRKSVGQGSRRKKRANSK